MTTETITEIDQKYVAHTYGRFPIELVSGKGSIVKDSSGKEYIDMGSGIAVNSFGICDDEWLAAITSQAQKLQHASNLYYTQPCAELAKELCTRTGMNKVFFSNSGAEANECAIKIARKYAAEAKGKDYCTVLTLKKSFHGRTLTTLAATGQDKFHEDFTPLTPGFAYAQANNFEDVKRVASEHKLCAIMFECIQGEGGVIELEQDFVQQIAQYTKENDIALIIDEVQTGNGRTGNLYAYMNYGIEPDIVSTAKGLGGGLPIGATLMSEKMSEVLKPGDHGSTFGGNPIACAGALSIINRLDDKFLNAIKEKENYIKKELEGTSGIYGVSGNGLMLGISTEKPAKEVVNKCIKQGVLCLTAGDKVRLLPALNIPQDLLEIAVQTIKSCCE
jgi:acetylornithine/N-succinyldiaminopimelate aminotransferase